MVHTYMTALMTYSLYNAILSNFNANGKIDDKGNLQKEEATVCFIMFGKKVWFRELQHNENEISYIVPPFAF